jgi:diguanylate cyclase (GGDEF)-like protein
MRSPPTPENEPMRLATLRSLSVLDSQPEERFDRLTRMAKRMFRAPIALVSLIDENRQWFKSCDGLSVSELPRETSFCGHAILGNDVFLIEDALKDERFADNPLVTGEPHIRFYAGCPLRAVNGAKMGTLCIIDTKPRAFDDEDITALKDLTAMVEAELTSFQLAITDELTKISNRRGFNILAQYSLDFCVRQHVTASLVFLDLDNFKQVNDTFGHAEGDYTLIRFSDALKTSFRDSDVFARLGGDEFLVLLTNASKLDAETAIGKLTQQIQVGNKAGQRVSDLSFSCGIVEFQSEKHKTIDDLLADGDLLMYQIKNEKKLR